jgi:hypothetical protein
MALPKAGRLNWAPTLFLCVAGLIIPNLLSLGSLVAGVGMPPRTAAIIAYATVIVLSRAVPPPAAVAAYLALLFNLAPSEIGMALHLAAELKPWKAPIYLGMAAGLTAMLAVNVLVLIRFNARLRQGNTIVLMGAALVLAAGDFASNTSLHYQFGTLYSAGKPIDAAVKTSGFLDTATTTRRNVLLVMVEALGEFADPQQQAVLLAPLRAPELLARYDVKIGGSTYYGSTTAGEMRELCQSREPYQTLIEHKGRGCLPDAMAARGFATIGMHNFTSRFFDRDKWYPNLGFQRRIFGEELVGQVPKLCGGAFSGPCDTDVVPLIGRELRAASKPTFLYWLTLSTHVPVQTGQATKRLGCDSKLATIPQYQVCSMAEMWIDLIKALADLTADIPPTEILIVGDHAPPIWSKAGRQLFEPGRVTWIRLSPKA